MDQLPKDRIDAIPIKQPEHLVSNAMKLEILTTALRTLSCLGNGKHLGNSDGNIIAQKALVRAGISLGEEPPTFTASINVTIPKPSIGNV